MAQKAGQKLRASMVSGGATNDRLLGADVGLAAGAVPLASQF